MARWHTRNFCADQPWRPRALQVRDEVEIVSSRQTVNSISSRRGPRAAASAGSRSRSEGISITIEGFLEQPAHGSHAAKSHNYSLTFREVERAPSHGNGTILAANGRQLAIEVTIDDVPAHSARIFLIYRSEKDEAFFGFGEQYSGNRRSTRTHATNDLPHAFGRRRLRALACPAAHSARIPP